MKEGLQEPNISAATGEILQENAESASNTPVPISKKTKLKKYFRFVLKLVSCFVILIVLVLVYIAVDFDNQIGFAQKDIAKQELESFGIPKDQKYSAYKQGISELLYRSVEPRGYQDSPSPHGFCPDFFFLLEKWGVPGLGMVQEFVPNLLYGREVRSEKLQTIGAKYHKMIEPIMSKRYEVEGYDREKVNDFFTLEQKELDEYFIDNFHTVISSSVTQPALDDAWRLYLGLPQLNHSFNISNYRPACSLEDRYYFKIPNFWYYVLEEFQSVEKLVTVLKQAKDSAIFKAPYILPPDKTEEFKKCGNDRVCKEELLRLYGSDVLFHYKLSLGHDDHGYYVSYYDRWDLSSFFAENIISRGVGKPMEIYDRLYYDPVTYEVIERK